MNTVLVQVPAGTSPFQVEFPEFQLDKKGRPIKKIEGKGKDKKVTKLPFGERSCEGAMHVRPGTKSMTRAELDYITKTHGLKLRVIKEMSGKKVVAKPQPTPPPYTPPVGDSDGDKSEKGKGKKDKSDK